MSDQEAAARVLAQAQSLVPLLKEKAREAEIARRPLDEVIAAIAETDIWTMMVPKQYGGLALDLDAFFEVALTLSKADASMGWLTGFYVEHNLWLCHYAQSFRDQVFDGHRFVLAPGAINVAAGQARKVDGGYQVSGRWQWGTGIVHATWVMAGAMCDDGAGNKVPMVFCLPREEVDAIDTWHIAGMCATGSWDFAIDDKFVPDDRAVSFLDILMGTTGIRETFSEPIYHRPMMMVLALTAAVPILGAAQMAVEEFCAQTKDKAKQSMMRAASGGGTHKHQVIADAALTVEAAELMLRQVLADVMAAGTGSTIEQRSGWMTRIAHSAYMCRDAVNKVAAIMGASGNMLSNPVQRAVRDINTASCHVVFDREARYGDFARLMLGEPMTSMMV